MYYPKKHFRVWRGIVQPLCTENTIFVSNITKRVFRIEKSHEAFEICKDCAFYKDSNKTEDCATILNQNFNLNIQSRCTELVPTNCIFKELKGGV